jgi:hypothetical protein
MIDFDSLYDNWRKTLIESFERNHTDPLWKKRAIDALKNKEEFIDTCKKNEEFFIFVQSLPII